MTGRPVRPVDAAGLILLRGSREAPEILLGRRHSKTAFLPDIYVVPGGRVDAEDLQPSGFAEEVHPAVAGDLAIGCRTPPIAFLRAALRETHEETGLLVGNLGRASKAPSGAAWGAYAAAGRVPDFGGLDFVLRAITPRGSPRRYNTRFFLGDGSRVAGTLTGNGELLDLGWRPTGALDRLNIVDVTWELIRAALRRWRDRIPVGADRPKLLIYRNDILQLRALPQAPTTGRIGRRA
jgi:8-oxo-dGTP pyrophosphatase MutT (NUDIX family)